MLRLALVAGAALNARAHTSVCIHIVISVDAETAGGGHRAPAITGKVKDEIKDTF
jgi:hypothetical protein